MKIQIWSIGKSDEAYIKSGVEEFTKRVNKYFSAEWIIIPTPKNSGLLSEMDLKKQEGKTILDWLEKDDYLILLDERGKEFTSPGLAAFLQQRLNESTKKLIFLIGGVYGIDETIMKRANFTWISSSVKEPMAFTEGRLLLKI